MQIARISGSNIKLNSSHYSFSGNKTNNTVNYQHNNTVLCNMMPDMVPFTATKKADSSKDAVEIKSIQETLDEKYPNMPLREQLMNYHKDLVKEREIGLEKLNEIKPQVDKRIINAGEKIKTILEENGIQPKSGLFEETTNNSDDYDKKVAKRKNTYTLVSKKYPGTKLILTSSCRTEADLCKSNLVGTRIEEFHSDDLVLKRKETKYYTGYDFSCDDLLGKTGRGFIFPSFDKRNNIDWTKDYFLEVETPAGLFSGSKQSAKNLTRNVEYYYTEGGWQKPCKLKIEQSVKKDGVKEEIFCIDSGDNHVINELTYTKHQFKDDTKEHTFENQVVIRKKKDK